MFKKNTNGVMRLFMLLLTNTSFIMNIKTDNNSLLSTKNLKKLCLRVLLKYKNLTRINACVI